MENLNFFEKAVKLVSRYGSMTIFKTIIFIALFLFVIFYIPAITKTVVEKTTLETLINVDKEREVTHLKDVEIRKKIQPQIYAILEGLLQSTNADRAYIIELHNGSQNINAVPFLHGTVTYEKVKNGVENIDEEFQNLSLSRYEFSSYLHDNFNFLGTIDEIEKIDRRLALKLRSGDVSYVAVTTLHNGAKEWGWFGVLYSKGTEVPSKDKILNELVIASQTITKEMISIHGQNE